MKILSKHKGYQLVERYNNKKYIRFWGGREDNMPCEIPVSEEDAARLIDNPCEISCLIDQAKTKIKWTADSFFRLGIVEYLLYNLKLSEKRADETYDKLARFPDIREEFYRFIMDDSVFSSNPIKVEGFSAQYLAENYPLSPLGAYNYLVYLREMPEKALADLKTGLRNK